jgi:hypothetical protein
MCKHNQPRGCRVPLTSCLDLITLPLDGMLGRPRFCVLPMFRDAMILTDVVVSRRKVVCCEPLNTWFIACVVMEWVTT